LSWRKENNQPNYLTITWDLFKSLIGQTCSSQMRLNSPRNALNYIWYYSTIVVVSLFSAISYNRMINQPQKWCKTIECFANSPRPARTGDYTPAFEFLHSH